MAKTIQTRVQNKHDIETSWKEISTSFIPLAGEEIIYDPDETHAKPRVKIGDGTTTLENLPWALDEASTYTYIDDEITEVNARVSTLEGAVTEQVIVWVGTYAEYQAAYAAGEIAVGTVVVITDDDSSTAESGSTSAILGTAMLGYMILGQE